VNWAVLRREWGAVTFVLTVVAGMVVVPVALYFANVSPTPITTPNLNTSSSARSSSVHSPITTPSASAPRTTSPSP
jgi:hypothetical protein